MSEHKNTEKFIYFMRITIMGGLFITPFISLVVVNSLFFPFITGKAFVFRILVEVLIALWVILIVYEPKYRPRLSWILVILALFVVSIGFSNILALDFAKAFWSNFERMEGYVTLLHLFAYFVLLGTVLKGWSIWSRFFHVWLGVGFFLFLYGIEQALGEFVNHLSGERIDATLGNSTYLAALGIFFLFFAIYFAANERSRVTQVLSSYVIGSGLFILYTFYSYSERLSELQSKTGGIATDVQEKFFIGAGHGFLFVFSIIIISVCVALYFQQKNLSTVFIRRLHGFLYSILGLSFFSMILLTRTRGSIIGVVGGMSLTVILIALFARGRPRLQKIMAILALVGVFVGAIFLAMVVTNTAGTTQQVPVVREAYNILQDVPGLKRVSNIELGGKTVRSRFMIWNMASHGFLEKPLFGWGQENFYQVFNKYYDPRMYDQEPWFDRAHNVLFDWLIAGGIAGTVLYFSLIGFGLAYLWYDQDRGPIQRLRSSAERVMRSLTFFQSGEAVPKRFSVVDSSILTGLIVAYLFHNLFVFDNLISYLLFFSLLAFIYAINTPKENVVFFGTNEIQQQFKPAVIPIVLVLLVATVYSVNVRPIQANMLLIDGIINMRSGNYIEGKRMYEEAMMMETFGRDEVLTALGDDALMYIRTSGISLDIKNDIFMFTATELEKRLQEKPYSLRIRSAYGQLLSSAGHQDSAIEQYEYARSIAPKRQVTLFHLGQAYISKGELEKALNIFREAFDFQPDYFKARENYLYASLLKGEEEDIERALTYGGDYTEEQLAFGDKILSAYVQNKEWERAIELITLRIQILKEDLKVKSSQQNFEDLVKSYTMFSDIFVEKGDKGKALSILREGIELIPSAKTYFETLISKIEVGA